MQALKAELPSEEEMRHARGALARLADELDRLCADIDDLRPHAMMAWLRSAMPMTSFKWIVEGIDFCDLIGDVLAQLDGGGAGSARTAMVRRARMETINAFAGLVDVMRQRAEQASPTVDLRPSTVPPPLAKTDPVRVAARALLVVYDGDMQGAGSERPLTTRDLEQVHILFENLRAALDGEVR